MSYKPLCKICETVINNKICLENVISATRARKEGIPSNYWYLPF